MNIGISSLIFLSVLLHTGLSNITLKSPEQYKDIIFDQHGQRGKLDYSLSLFGNVDYLREDDVQIVLPQPGNELGCDHFNLDKNKIQGKFAILLKRGKCTFTKKSLNAKLVC